ALATPAEAAAPAAAETTVADQCPPGFTLTNRWGLIEFGTIVVGPGDLNGDGYVCAMTIGSVKVIIDNRP
ncbi:MAG TPA: hypothetical protein VK936_02875, partial [Longimicrobiales bacterium]|nr:hypothetical protein [Longimicrobiales bacterium]